MICCTNFWIRQVVKLLVKNQTNYNLKWREYNLCLIHIRNHILWTLTKPKKFKHPTCRRCVTWQRRHVIYSKIVSMKQVFLRIILVSWTGFISAGIQPSSTRLLSQLSITHSATFKPPACEPERERRNPATPVCSPSSAIPHPLQLPGQTHQPLPSPASAPAHPLPRRRAEASRA